MHLRTQRKKWPRLHALEVEFIKRYPPSEDRESGLGRLSEKRDDNSVSEMALSRTASRQNS